MRPVLHETKTRQGQQQKNLQAIISNEHKYKNSQQNTRKPNLTKRSNWMNLYANQYVQYITSKNENQKSDHYLNVLER
jgi:hypothetical protein